MLTIYGMDGKTAVELIKKFEKCDIELVGNFNGLIDVEFKNDCTYTIRKRETETGLTLWSNDNIYGMSFANDTYASIGMS